MTHHYANMFYFYQISFKTMSFQWKIKVDLVYKNSVILAQLKHKTQSLKYSLNHVLKSQSKTPWRHLHPKSHGRDPLWTYTSKPSTRLNQVHSGDSHLKTIGSTILGPLRRPLWELFLVSPALFLSLFAYFSYFTSITNNNKKTPNKTYFPDHIKNKRYP